MDSQGYYKKYIRVLYGRVVHILEGIWREGLEENFREQALIDETKI